MATGRITNKGDFITIYQKPITEEEPEGTAQLVSCISRRVDTFNGRDIEDWEVRFEGEKETYRRTVLV